MSFHIRIEVFDDDSSLVLVPQASSNEFDGDDLGVNALVVLVLSLVSNVVRDLGLFLVFLIQSSRSLESVDEVDVLSDDRNALRRDERLLGRRLVERARVSIEVETTLMKEDLRRGALLVVRRLEVSGNGTYPPA